MLYYYELILLNNFYFLEIPESQSDSDTKYVNTRFSSL